MDRFDASIVLYAARGCTLGKIQDLVARDTRILLLAAKDGPRLGVVASVDVNDYLSAALDSDLSLDAIERVVSRIRETAVILPQRTVTHGDEHAIGDLAAGDVAHRLRVHRCTTSRPDVFSDPLTWISVELFVSLDGGKTWGSGGGFEAFGGVHTSWRDGRETDYAQIDPEPLPGGGLAKVVYQVRRAPEKAGPEEVASLEALRATGREYSEAQRVISSEWQPDAGVLSGEARFYGL